MEVTLDTIIGDVIDADSGTAEIFLGSGMHCFSCPVSRMESIAEAAEIHQIDAEALVKKLNEYFASKK